jgi:hypothetical protein
VSRSSAAWLLAVVVLGGCGGSSGHDKVEKELTVPAYGAFPALTVPVTSGTPALCRAEAQAFARAGVASLAPFPSDADVYWHNARLQFFEFKAHRCDTAILRKAFSRRLTVKQRRVVVAYFGFLGETGRELTRAPQN